MPRFRNGLVVGKFSPLHKGHELLLRRASEQCEKLTVFSYYAPEFAGCESHRREKWLKTLFPEARVFVIDDEYAHRRWDFGLPRNGAGDLAERRFTAFLWLELVNEPLDAVFTSELYGDGWAAELARYFAEYTVFPPVEHVLVDLERAAVPISGTRLRENVHELREFLSPIVYASFVERIAFLGGESSGKSTLTERLAGEFGTAFVPEYGRTLSEEKNNVLVYEDLLRIAKRHIADEERLAQTADRYLFIDTTPLTTLFYSRHLFDRADPELEWLASRRYDRVFLCAPDFPFVQDGWREDGGLRERQHDWYLRTLNERGVEFTLLTGSLDERVAAVNRCLGRK